ncbi:MAG: hypothetical protein OHK0028_21820 [Deltaproteobacteria bacterium]
MRRNPMLFPMLLLAILPACGGGGGGGNASPYTGLTTPAVISASNADNIARLAFQGGDLGASTSLAPARTGDTPKTAGKPMVLTLVPFLSGAANAVFPGPAAVRAPQPRSTETGRLYDGQGIGWADFTLNVNDQTGQFTGAFVFTNFHGDGGGVIDGRVAVSGVAGQYSVQILFDFQSVHVVDPGSGEDLSAYGTLNLAIEPGTGNVVGGVTLNMVFVDNVTHKTLWLSDVTLGETVGTGFVDVTISGRIYLHDYGYVDMTTVMPFHYPSGDSFPSSGRFIVTGKDNTKVQLTVVDSSRYRLDVDTNGDDLWEVTSGVLDW